MNFIEIIPLETADYDMMKEYFGITDNMQIAGYLLPDGTLLDFSGKHWGNDYYDFRQVDHRDIGKIWNRGRENSEEMVNAIANGCIRLVPENGGICLAAMPTREQYPVLDRYIRFHKGECVIDIDAAGGDTMHSLIYQKMTSPVIIFEEMEEYFTKTYKRDYNRLMRQYIEDKTCDDYEER